MTERPVAFGPGGGLLGVLATTHGPTSLPAVVLLNSGVLPRVGPGRLYVELSRRLAALGFPSLRFDLSGVGESPARTDGLTPEETVVADTRAALDLLSREGIAKRFVLGGLCSGATVSLMTARADTRVVGGLLLNAREHLLLDPADRAANLELWRKARSRHMLRLATRSSFRGQIARRVVTGGIDLGPALRAVVSGLGRTQPGMAPSTAAASAAAPSAAAPDPAAGLRALHARGVRLLHVYAEADEGLDYLQVALGPGWRTPLGAGGGEVKVLPGVNHLFTPGWSQVELFEVIEDWMRGFFPAAGDA